MNFIFSEFLPFDLLFKTLLSKTLAEEIFKKLCKTKEKERKLSGHKISHFQNKD